MNVNTYSTTFSSLTELFTANLEALKIYDCQLRNIVSCMVAFYKPKQFKLGHMFYQFRQIQFVVTMAISIVK